MRDSKFESCKIVYNDFSEHYFFKKDDDTILGFKSLEDVKECAYILNKIADTMLLEEQSEHSIVKGIQVF